MFVLKNPKKYVPKKYVFKKCVFVVKNCKQYLCEKSPKNIFVKKFQKKKYVC